MTFPFQTFVRLTRRTFKGNDHQAVMAVGEPRVTFMIDTADTKIHKAAFHVLGHQIRLEKKDK